MTSKQTADSKNHNPEGHNQYTENSKSAASGSGQDGKSSASQNQQGGNHAQGRNQSSEDSKSSSSGSGQGGKSSGSPSSHQQGGTHEQHVKAGQQSHKNS